MTATGCVLGGIITCQHVWTELQKTREADDSERGLRMSRSKSYGNLHQTQTESPSKLPELEPDKPAISFSSHGSGDPATLTPQDQVPDFSSPLQL